MVVATGLAVGVRQVSQSKPAGGVQKYVTPPEADNCMAEPKLMVTSAPAFAVGPPLAATVPLAVFVQPKESVMVTE